MRLKHYEKRRIRIIIKSISILSICCAGVLCLHWRLRRTSADLPRKRVLPVYWWSEVVPPNMLSGHDAFSVTRVDSLDDVYDDVERHKHYQFLVLRGNVVVSPTFAHVWRTQLASAPPDWDMLQLWSNNRVVQDHVERIIDPWISWMPEHTGEEAFFMTREGLAKVMTAKGPLFQRGHAKVPLFQRGHTYTATRFWIKADAMFEFPWRIYPFEHPNADMLIVVSCLLKSVPDIEREYQRWHADWSSIGADWLLTLVVPNETMKKHALATWRVSTGVRLNVQVYAGQFNKFRFIRPWVSAFKRYTHVVFKDSDQNVAGFPWRTFIEETGDAVISAPLRQLVTGPDARQWFHQFDAAVWKAQLTDAFGSVQTLDPPVLEQYFVRMDGGFATWFWDQVLTDTLLTDKDGNDVVSNWGPDIVWCGAAQEYAPNRGACRLVPVVSKHDDTRQVQHWRASSRRQYLNQMQLQAFRDAFPQWLLDHRTDVAH